MTIKFGEMDRPWGCTFTPTDTTLLSANITQKLWCHQLLTMSTHLAVATSTDTLTDVLAAGCWEFDAE